MYVNGTSVVSSTLSSTLPATTQNIFLGRRWDLAGSNSFLDGFLDDFRLTKGVARYTSNFIVPSSPFPNS
jgi:hypothetical protein